MTTRVSQLFMVCGESETTGMLSLDCRKTSALIVQQLASVRAPHAALLFAHDQLGSALQLQYATALDARARQEQTEACFDRSLLATVLSEVIHKTIISAVHDRALQLRHITSSNIWSVQAVAAVQQALQVVDVADFGSIANIAELEVRGCLTITS